MTSPDPGVKRYTLAKPPTSDAPAEEGPHKDPAIRRSLAVRYPRSLHNAESPVSAIETGFMNAFKPLVLPEMQSKIDKLGWCCYISGGSIPNAVYALVEERLSKPVNKANEAYEKLNAFYTANSATITRLDALGQLHPFVGVTVTAFKLVITLDITWWQNNKKVIDHTLPVLPHFSSDSIVADILIARLRHMPDPEEKGPDGTTLKDRFSGLMQSIAKDITSCAKTIKSKIYESRLAGYMAMFTNHKKEIGFALKFSMALGVDVANKKLDTQDLHLKVIEDKMEALFGKLDTPRERNVQKFIEDKGGAKACVDNDTTLKELISKGGENLASLDPTHSGNGDLVSAKKLLNMELAEDVDEAFKNNMKLFDHKLEMQSKQLTDTITSTGEHIINVLSSGAHDRILDEDLQAIWKEQGWKGSVKATAATLLWRKALWVRSPALPLPPRFCPPRPLRSQRKLHPSETPEDDRWALAYINVAHLQSILEAVDDDSTGYVTIKEANDFTMSCPKGWSLLSWLAFWASGWHATVTWYKNQMYNILDAMSNDARLSRIADAFQDLEEEKIVSRRIERRHFDIMRLACIHILDPDEFQDRSKSLAIVFKAADERTSTLEAVFKSTSTDVRDRLGQVAFGMFQLSYGQYLRDPINNTAHVFVEEDGFEDNDEDKLLNRSRLIWKEL
ncbi:hypothetical protein B0H14DRAFT_2571888 [Mycena olivaceomarginata]|nr:hypothetical protein B0H14DRAFT_2571888 [Mycena olivaceomarginata]